MASLPTDLTRLTSAVVPVEVIEQAARRTADEQYEQWGRAARRLLELEAELEAYRLAVAKVRERCRRPPGRRAAEVLYLP